MKRKQTTKRKTTHLHLPRKWLLILIIITGVAIVGGRVAVYLTSADQVCWWDDYVEETVCGQVSTDPPPSGGGGGGNPPTSTNPVTTDTYVPPANPALAESCKGYDIAFLIDTSGSVQGTPLQKERAAMRAFISALNGLPMMFSTARIDYAGSGTFTADTAQALSDVDSGSSGQSGSYIYGAEGILHKDQRASRQNLVIILTDGRFGGSAMGLLGTNGIDQLKRAGTRLLVIGVGHIDLTSLKNVSGSNVNTGSVFTSDVITTDYDNLGGQLASVAGQLCKSKTGSNSTGNGGEGSGINGSGKGGAGSSGGSSATRQSNAPNAITETTSQGANQQNQTTTPSPFYDGKLYAAGSDASKSTITALIERTTTAPFVAATVCLTLIAAGTVTWWLRYRRKRQSLPHRRLR